MKALVTCERFLLVVGFSLLAIYGAMRVYTLTASHLELQRFWSSQKSEPAQAPKTNAGEPDTQLWSPKRIAAYKASLADAVPPPLAVLRIPSLHLEVPVLEGTDDLTLDRAVGHIQGTPEPGEEGNIGIAGHRDGFFRGLKDIQQGDAIEVVTGNRTDLYHVDEMQIVTPQDVSVLRPREAATLTLVTCYPFYYVGSAPQRFIVHAKLATSVESAQTAQENRP